MPIERLIPPRDRDLGGGFMVRRLLPSVAPRQGVGPFVFFDHFGPITARPGDNHDVRPHPHIGLATVTDLLEGAMMHRDSLGSVQRIEPGAINWMTAGRGIVHSERAPPDLKQREYVAHGLQLWVALPKLNEEADPAFTHTPATAIPEWSASGIRARVLVGNAFGLRSPVVTYCQTLYLDVVAQSGAMLVLAPPEDAAFERAIYSVGEPLQVDGEAVPAFSMAVLAPGAGATVEAPRGARYVVIGGEPLDAPRTIWWNFVSSRKERIEQAKADWTAQRMGGIDGEHEWIPLP